MRPEHIFSRPFGSRIALSPWAATAADPAAMQRLNERCEELDVIVSTAKRSRDGSWMIRVRRGQTLTSLVGKGKVEAVIAGALDDFEART